VPRVTTRALALSPATRRQVRWILVVAAIVGVIIGVQTLVLHLRTDPLADVHAYYDAGSRLNAGQPLYDQPATTDEAAFYRYPPLLAIAFRPLAQLPFPVAAAIWEGTLIALFALTIWRIGGRDPRTWLVVSYLAAPIAWTLAIGQAHMAVTFLMALASPWAVALAAQLKLFPALLAVWWIGRREWRDLALFTAWMVGLVILQLILEPAGTLAYLSFPDLAQVGNVQNLSLYSSSPYLWIAFVAALVLIALRLAPTRWGWIAAVALSVFATPRLNMYQFAALLAAKAPVDRPRPPAPQRDPST
jgi:hypothetical protein